MAAAAAGLIGVPISLVPVLVFLLLLIFMDSYKLVPRRRVVVALVIGGVAAMVSLGLNSRLIDGLALAAPQWTEKEQRNLFQRYVAPFSEELLKSCYVVYVLRARQVGFTVDAAILGFAVGAGFALVENLYYLFYLGTLEGGRVVDWIVRGFGTAVMHGSATAIFAMLSKSLADRRVGWGALVFLPGLGAAIGIHSFFNHFLLNPLAMTALFLVVLPLLVIVVFERSENVTRSWLGTGIDSDMELLELILSGEIRQSRIGKYLQSLKTHFPGTVVADMLCLLRIHVELSLQAKAQLLARRSGIRIAPGEAVRANLEELRFLEKAVGKTGLLALQPFLKTSSRELWQLYVLRK